MAPNERTYSSFQEYLDALLEDKESDCVEFKHGKGSFPKKKFWESYGKSNGERSGERNERKRLSYTELTNRIMAFCGNWKSSQEIAEQLCYRASYLSSRVLSRMISEGLIEPLHKDNAKHRGQKYKTTSKGKKILSKK